MFVLKAHFQNSQIFFFKGLWVFRNEKWMVYPQIKQRGKFILSDNILPIRS